MKKIVWVMILLVIISSAFGLYESNEDRDGDGFIDSWYADTNGDQRYDRWHYDINGDGRADYSLYDLDNNCYPEYTNVIYPNTAIGNLNYNHFYADLNEDGYYERKAYDTNVGDYYADLYTYDRDGNGIYEDYRQDKNFDFTDPQGPELFDAWFYDADQNGIMEKCMHDTNADNNFSEGVDTLLEYEGCYTSFIPPLTSNVVYNYNQWPCYYYLPNGDDEEDIIRDEIIVEHFNFREGELSTIYPGDIAFVRIRFYNNGDRDLDGISARISIPDLDVLTAKKRIYSLDSDQSASMTFALEIPDNAFQGEYMARLVLYNGDTTRIIHRPIVIS